MADTQRFNEGLAAYREGKFTEAINLLKLCVEADLADWPSALYLGMSFFRAERLAEAETMFRYILGKCPDRELRAKAEVAISPIREALRKEAAEFGTGTSKTDSAWLDLLLKGKRP